MHSDKVRRFLRHSVHSPVSYRFVRYSEVSEKNVPQNLKRF